MSALTVKGWCPSALRPMESGDGYLVRIKPRSARVAADRLRAIAEAAGRFGNGLVDLTNRGNLQIRGLTRASLDDFSSWVQASGLASGTPSAEAIRNILADPLGSDNPSATFDSHTLARQMATALEETASLHDLPEKIDILVDAGGPLGLTDATAAIMIRAEGNICRIDLAGGRTGRSMPVADIVPAVLRLLGCLLAWIEAADRRPPMARRRMAQMVDARGADIVFDAATVGGTVVQAREGSVAPPQALFGFHAVGSKTGYLGAGAPFGSLQTDDLRLLADLADAYGDGAVRLTPWRAIVLAGVPVRNAAAIAMAAAGRGLIVSADDSRRRVIACAGAPGCSAGLSPTRSDAEQFLDAACPIDGTVHLSGCRKGCAHPRPARWTAVATAPGRFDVIRNGAVTDPPVRRAVATADLAATMAGLDDRSVDAAWAAA